MKPEIYRLDSRNLEDWEELTALGNRMRQMYLNREPGRYDQADMNVQATFTQWVERPDTVGLWVVRNVDLPHIDWPGADCIGHAVAFLRMEEGEIYAMLWQMQMDTARLKYGRILADTVAAWAKERGATHLRILTPRNPRVVERMFGYKFCSYSMRKDL